jgi:hypothetical protein
MKILLDFNEKAEVKIFSKEQSGMRVYMKPVNENGIRVVNFAMQKNLIVSTKNRTVIAQSV